MKEKLSFFIWISSFSLANSLGTVIHSLLSNKRSNFHINLITHNIRHFYLGKDYDKFQYAMMIFMVFGHRLLNYDSDWTRTIALYNV
jgi:hypothetical protein